MAETQGPGLLWRPETYGERDLRRLRKELDLSRSLSEASFNIITVSQKEAITVHGSSLISIAATTARLRLSKVPMYVLKYNTVQYKYSSKVL